MVAAGIIFAVSACSSVSDAPTTSGETTTTSLAVTTTEPAPTTTSTTTVPTTTPPSTTTTTDPTTTSSSGEGTTPTQGTTPTTVPERNENIEDVDAAALAHSYTADCPVRPEDVVLVRVRHWGFDGQVHNGAIVVARAQGEAVADIFARLFAARYPIQSVIPIGDLPVGIEDSDPNYNNTSALHCRRATGSTRWSEHAKGLAIDINPFQNPFITPNILWPANSERYLDRTLGEPGMIVDDDVVVRAFAANGWLWGGYWSSIKDYQHFSVSGR